MAESGLSLLWHFFAASQRVKSLLATAMADSPLTADEYAVYSVLVDVGPLPPTELARRLGMPPTTMSHYVRALIQSGHARRMPAAHDGRSYVLELTEAGRATHRSAAEAFLAANDRFRVALEVDEAFLARSLTQVGAAAEHAAQALAAARERAA